MNNRKIQKVNKLNFFYFLKEFSHCESFSAHRIWYVIITLSKIFCHNADTTIQIADFFIDTK